ncbi:MAG: glycoside hydrolase [Pseudomonadota bacterium]|nr:glycoside hydrolase [Pseudomonadota bacterium]
MGWAAAAEKTDPLQASRNDPRSGGALNLEAAKAARASGKLPLKGTAPRDIFHSTVNDPDPCCVVFTQSETTIIDLGGGNLVAAFNDSDSYEGSNHLIGYAWSNTNGISWKEPGRLPDSTAGDGSDPVLAHHKATNSVYLATLGFTTNQNIQVFKSTDGGHTFGAPVNATPGFGSGNFQDKPWLTADNFAGTGNGNIYLCWTRVGATEDIFLSRSTDGGTTFGPSGGTLISPGGQGCFVAVSPNHQVNVFYYRGTGPGGQGGDNKIFVRRSLDLGVTFQPEVQVADLNTMSVNGGLELNGGLRSNSFPHAAVNPIVARPFIYVAYNDIDPTNPSNKADTFFVKSTDGGTTWSAPARINDDEPGDQFFPTLAITGSGNRIMFGYYSRSQDSSNFFYHRRARVGRLGAAGNITFSPSFQLSPNTPIVIWSGLYFRPHLHG